MSMHIEAPPGAVAPRVLLPGDPLRARHVAQTLLTDATCVNERRAEYGFTGAYRGVRVSVQATGMGSPSIAIYAHELVADYGARWLVRLGTCGALQPGLRVGDVLLASAASTDSAMNRHVFRGMDYAPAADFALLRSAWERAQARGMSVKVGGVVTCDRFYAPDDAWRVFAEHGVLAAEMETSALYTVAARLGAAALSVLTVSDVVGTSEAMAPADREKLLRPAAELALEVLAAA